MNPAELDDAELYKHTTTLNDQQLSDVIAAVDAAEVLAKARQIDMGASARYYAQKLRWPVFPLRARGKTPLTTHGFKDATRHIEQIRAWWTEWPEANIGIPTGQAEHGGCGYDVLDIDGPDGIRAWATIRHAQCPPNCCAQQFCPAPGPFNIQAIAFTPGDGVDRKPGRHLYLPATGKGNTTRINGQPLDWRGRGGYVVAPPSVGLSGVRYSWLQWPIAL